MNLLQLRDMLGRFPAAVCGGVLLLQAVSCIPPEALAGYEEGMEAYRKAWAAYATQRYEEARRLTRAAIQADPGNPHAHALAGDLAYLAHELAGAKKAWAEALALEPRLRAMTERLAQLDREQALEAGQVALTTELFVIRVPADASIETTWVLQELQAAQAFLETQLQCRLQGPLTVLIYDPVTFYSGFHVPTAVAGLFDGKIRLPASTAAQAVIWHELTHAAVHQLAHGHAPRWLHEGVAQAVEAHVATIPTESLRIALRRDAAPSMAQLEGRSAEFGQAVPMEAGVFYQASWARVQYMVDHQGWAGLRRFLDAVGAGASTTEALFRVTRLAEAAWDRQWRRWAQTRLESP